MSSGSITVNARCLWLDEQTIDHREPIPRASGDDNLTRSNTTPGQRRDIDLMRHDQEPLIRRQGRDQIKRCRCLGRPVTAPGKEGVERRRFLHIAHLHQYSRVTCPAPLTGPDAIKGDPGATQRIASAPGLLTTADIQITLRAAIADREPCRISRSGGKRVPHQRNDSRLSQRLSPLRSGTSCAHSKPDTK